MNSTINININQNTGIVSTGEGSHNEQVIETVYQKSDDINWEALRKEISNLKTSSNPSIKEFADEAIEPAENENKKGIRNVLIKWFPHIGSLIESSYYIIEMAKNFGIKIS